MIFAVPPVGISNSVLSVALSYIDKHTANQVSTILLKKKLHKILRLNLPSQCFEVSLPQLLRSAGQV